MSRSLEKIGQQLVSAVVVLFGLYVVAKIYMAGQFIVAFQGLARGHQVLFGVVPVNQLVASAEM